MDERCERVRQSIDWFLDDELDGEATLELEAHLNSCSHCRDYFEMRLELRGVVRAAGESVRCPAKLRQKVVKVLDVERRRTRWSMRRWPAAAAAAAVLVAFVWRGGLAGEDLDAVAERHARNLPMDVVSANVSQVQQYFRGKLPFRVALPKLRDRPESNCGGRLVHLRNQDAAYVRCDLPQGKVSLFVYQDSDAGFHELAPLYRLGRSRFMIKQVRGYTVAKWHASGLTYSLVADMPQKEVYKVLQASLR